MNEFHDYKIALNDLNNFSLKLSKKPSSDVDMAIFYIIYKKYQEEQLELSDASKSRLLAKIDNNELHDLVEMGDKDAIAVYTWLEDVGFPYLRSMEDRKGEA